jgi:hypothetical protein
VSAAAAQLAEPTELDDPWKAVEPELVELFSDFKSFCSLLEIRTKEIEGADGRKTFHYEDWHPEQRQFEAERTGLDIVLKGRQIGFSTLELARDLWFAIVHPGVSVLVIIHDEPLAVQLWNTLSIFAKCLADIGLLPTTKRSTLKELVFRKSRSEVSIIQAGSSAHAAKKKGRSQVVHRLHATEVAFWLAAQETMGAVMQSVPIGGEICIESTANGAGGLFYRTVQMAREGRGRFKLHFFPWWKHSKYRLPEGDDFDPRPRDDWERRLRELGCDDQQIAFWRSKVDDPTVGLETALAEFPIDAETCFRTSGRSWFEAAVLDKIAQYVCEPLETIDIEDWSSGAAMRYPGLRIYAQPEPDVEYVMFADLAEGKAQDGSAVAVLAARSGETVATWWSDTTAPTDVGAALDTLGRMYNNALLGVEREANGTAALERLRGLDYPRIYKHGDGRAGWIQNAATRPVMWEEMAHAIRDGSAYTPDAATLAECRTIILDEDGKPRARGKRAHSKDSCRDDRFVAWAGAWQMRAVALAVGGQAQQPQGAKIERDHW